MTKTYDEAVPVHALRSTDLVVRQGEYAAVMGASGSGKSTLLNILGLLDRPTTGRYRIFGLDSAALTEPARTALRSQLFGFVFQSFHLLAGRSAVDNVALGMLYGSVSRRERKERAVAALSRVGLGHRLSSDPRNLSGGERQRVAIARALAPAPEVLLCDEPTGNLDSSNASHVLDLLEELHTDGLTVLVVTHDGGIGSRADRVFNVRDGAVSGAEATR